MIHYDSAGAGSALVERNDIFFFGHVDYQCPAALTPGQMQEMTSAAGKVFQALGCRDVTRADFRMTFAVCVVTVIPLWKAAIASS